jgi:serine/threonine protein kinase
MSIKQSQTGNYQQLSRWSLTCPYCGYEEGAAPESLLHLPAGTVLQGKYLLGRVLGQGGFGITYLAWDMTLNLKLAIKEYLPQQLATRTGNDSRVTVYKDSLAAQFSYGMTKFLEEARTLARFNEHPNIVTVRDYFEANNTAYLVMNHHEGVTLQSYLDSKSGRIPVAQALAIFMPVLDALKEVHRAGILHRDISPDNLLIDRSGRVVLIDFGAARQAMGEKSKSLSVIMKAGYSPPEQYQSKGKQGPWTDIYAVAATIYRAITAKAPLEAIDRMVEDDLVPPSQLGIEIEPSLEKALLKALAVKAADRYQAVEDFQTSLLVSGQGLKENQTAAVLGAVKPGNRSAGEQAAQEQPPVLVKEPIQQQKAGAASDGLSIAISKKAIGYAVAFIAIGVLLFIGGISLFGGGDEAAKLAGPTAEEAGQGAVGFKGEGTGQGEAGQEEEAEEGKVTGAVDVQTFVTNL